MLTRTITFFLYVSFLFLGPGGAGSPPQLKAGNTRISALPNEGTFLILTDIHFDPFFANDPRLIEELISQPVEKWQSIFESVSANQTVSPGGTDTNYPLLTSALDAAEKSDVKYDYALITGDFLAHNFPEKYRRFRPDGSGYQAFVIKTMAFVNRTVQHAFPAIPLYEALGNNDTETDDYAAQGRSLLAALAKEWQVVATRPSARKDFLLGGYYAVPHPTVPSQELIVLNTAYWSNRYHSPSSDPGSVELKWLASELDSVQAKHNTATLLMHIPPGFDANASAKSGQCATPTPFWKPQYLSSFLAILSAHRDSVRDGYAGHTHIDDFRILTDAAGMPYFQIHIAPSIGRNLQNNSAFEIGVYDKSTGALVDYAATYMRESFPASTKPEWKVAYDFRQESYMRSYNPASLQAIALLIRSSELVRNRLMDMFGARTSPTSAAAAKDWRFYSCAQTEMSPSAYTACACPSPVGNN
jgi:sphingomyelin phosphodiesterase acid-like 3